ncbi:MAG: hypothetical protein BA863_03600 [Desulfovibrio sp. S3730MH75]|nr:MAG: hypothetical protein BA863_03600 [Desulfovibrio sp. S3730MH75]
MTTQKEWSLSNPPPEGDPDVASFANHLFEIARLELERVGKHKDLLANYSMYRGKTMSGDVGKNQGLTPVNLLFANVERTVANITSREPVGEVVDLDGTDEDGAEDILSSKLIKWWRETNQQNKIRSSARTMEIYGITLEKPAWCKVLESPTISICDPFAFYPAPGFYENIDVELPFGTFVYLKYVDEIEADFKVTGVVADDAYDLLGTVREEYKGTGYGPLDTSLTGKYADPMVKANMGQRGMTDKKLERCLVKEVWIRDRRTTTVTEEHPVIDPETGMPELDETGEMVIEKRKTTTSTYPDGVRKITIVGSKAKEVQNGYAVLDDSANPNINPALPPEIACNTYPWGRFPVYHANSYKDLISLWGFAAGEQVGDLIIKIGKIISKLTNYVLNVMTPPLIVQKHCGITREMIESQLRKNGRLILMPTTPNARIEFMQIPNLPATFFQVLDKMIGFFDRIYAIESADRGEAPSGVIAASAIVALQERNQELTQAKTSAIEGLAENRSRWCIGLYQNFGTTSELVEVGGDPAEFIGTAFAGRKFSFVVESGSTSPRTSLQVQEVAKWLWETKAIDQRAVLEIMNIPDWKGIVERTGETQLDMALQVLIDSGLPEEAAFELKQYLMEPDQGAGGEKAPQSKSSENAEVGTPKTKQGEKTNEK